MESSKIEQAAQIVCRNPQHMPQIVSLLLGSLSLERIDSMSVQKLVEHWWEEQLFLGIDLGLQPQVREYELYPQQKAG